MATAADSEQGEQMFDYSLTQRCTRRWAHTPAVDPATGTIVSKRELVTPRDTGIRIEEPPVSLLRAGGITTCNVTASNIESLEGALIATDEGAIGESADVNP